MPSSHMPASPAPVWGNDIINKTQPGLLVSLWGKETRRDGEITCDLVTFNDLDHLQHTTAYSLLLHRPSSNSLAKLELAVPFALCHLACVRSRDLPSDVDSDRIESSLDVENYVDRANERTGEYQLDRPVISAH